MLAAWLRSVALRAVLAVPCMFGWPFPARAWDTYQVIIWQNQTAEAYRSWRRLGVTAGAVIADRERFDRDVVESATDPLRDARLGFYLENIATDFYAPYHRWRPDAAVNAAYEATIARWRANGADPGVFVRDPSLLDAAWRARIAARLTNMVRAYGPQRPLFYSLGDETGIADLSAAWDFDRSPRSLAGMRVWLHQQYASLDALNATWGTHFAAWDDVAPDTTFTAMRRADRNFASWSDFKAWMDVSFADAVRSGTDALHAADPSALAGIEGVQLPGWGGYDYATLASAVDVMEIYEDEANLEIAQDLHPGLVVLTTSHAEIVANTDAARGAWQSLLRGARGLILWDGNGTLVSPDGVTGSHAANLADALARMTERVAPALLASAPLHDPVAILYSQPSFRARWMLDQRPHGDAWVDRGADGENDDNAWRHAMRSAATQLLHLGITPRWIDRSQLASGLPAETRLLLLPQSIAMSDSEAAGISTFVARGGHVVADTAPGVFTEHLRERETPVLAEAANVRVIPGLWNDVDRVAQGRMGDLLTWAGVAPRVAIANRAGDRTSDVEIRLRRAEGGLLVSLLRDAAADGDNDAEGVVLACAGASGLEDVGTGARPEPSDHVSLSVSRNEPVVLLVRLPPGGRC